MGLSLRLHRENSIDQDLPSTAYKVGQQTSLTNRKEEKVTMLTRIIVMMCVTEQ